MRLPEDFNVEFIASEAERRGILIEPVGHYCADREHAENCFRMGVTSLPVEKIRPGVAELTELIRMLVSGRVEHLETSVGEWLTGGDLKSAMTNKTIIYNVVYGVPCTIDLHADGRMVGTAGYANEDSDVGRWHRQWNEWCMARNAPITSSSTTTASRLRVHSRDGPTRLTAPRGGLESSFTLCTCRGPTRKREAIARRRRGVLPETEPVQYRDAGRQQITPLRLVSRGRVSYSRTLISRARRRAARLPGEIGSTE